MSTTHSNTLAAVATESNTHMHTTNSPPLYTVHHIIHYFLKVQGRRGEGGGVSYIYKYKPRY